jgi:hypothetical protein
MLLDNYDFIGSKRYYSPNSWEVVNFHAAANRAYECVGGAKVVYIQFSPTYKRD